MMMMINCTEQRNADGCTRTRYLEDLLRNDKQKKAVSITDLKKDKANLVTGRGGP
jgi:hypothetical protein